MVATALAVSREERRLDGGWRFHRGEVAGAEAAAFDDAGWAGVTLPHDWSIAGPVDAAAPAAGHGGYFPTGTGWYRKTLAAPEAWRGRRVEIEFEGAAMGAEVWLNGVALGRWAYGYTPFRFDLTPHLRVGADNVLAVRVDNSAQPNSRWYSGSGLYRPVWLRVTDPVHVPEGGVWVTTEDLSDKQARLRVHAEVTNSSSDTREVTVETDAAAPRCPPTASGKVRLTRWCAGRGRGVRIHPRCIGRSLALRLRRAGACSTRPRRPLASAPCESRPSAVSS